MAVEDFIAQGGIGQLVGAGQSQSEQGRPLDLSGGLIVVLLFGIAMENDFIALRSRDKYAMYVVVGVACMIFAHVFENIGMAMGVMPVTGIPSVHQLWRL